MGKKIMLQGTASNVGKSILTAGLCRIFKQDGYSVAPFKSQNMALNSFITKEGLEMGRAQVFQAEACGIDPVADMNPILLKPSGNHRCQVIVRGKVREDMASSKYHTYKPQLAKELKTIFSEFSNNYDIVVMEGAGSTAEILYNSAKGRTRRIKCRLQSLEYSEKDDKFRLNVAGCRNVDMLRLAGIEEILLCPGLYCKQGQPEPPKMLCMEAELINCRNALERAMLHFAHFERETAHLGGNRYRLRIYYSENDETEMLIRVLSFGPMMKVNAPESLVDEIKKRLKMQFELGIR